MRNRSGRALRRGAVVVLTLCMTAGIGGVAIADAPAPGTTSLVVRTAGRVPTAAQLARSVPSVDVRRVRALGAGLAAVEVRGSGSAVRQAAALEASPLVRAAAPDRRFTIAGTAAPVSGGDPYFRRQWDLWDSASTKRAGGYGVDASRAWRTTTGAAGVVVAVLDTGITAHPDLAGARLVDGRDFVSVQDGIATGDGDGWDADPTDEGDACPALREPSSWHGTFVAGEIVAQRNGKGVVGQARGVSLEPVRVLGACGGSEADSIAAIEWASGGVVDGVPANAHPAQVISMSLGSADGPCSDALQAAIDGARSRGSVVVAAAGNEGAPLATTSPANCGGVISVTATTRAGHLASYSNRGTAAAAATVAAPGGSNADPVLGLGWSSRTTLRAAGTEPVLEWSEGTSMATPRVSAAIALLLSVRPGLTPDEVAARVTATATPFPASAGCTPTRCGAGVVNAGNLVGASRLFVHASPTTVSGTARAGHRLVAHAGTWRAAPTRVRYQWLRDGRAIASATGRTYLVRGRDAGHRIAVRVAVLRTGTDSAAARSSARRIAR